MFLLLHLNQLYETIIMKSIVNARIGVIFLL